MIQSGSLTRRAALTAVGAAALATTPLRAQTGLAVTASGRVFDIQTGGGLTGVMVSNGREVVLTGSDGRYAVSVAPGQSVFVIKPTGYATPVDPATFVPAFAYPYEPDGSPPGLRYGGLPPTGRLPASIDFPLRRAQEASRFDVLLLTDPQPEILAELEYVRRDVIEKIAAATSEGVPAAAFGIVTGDLMFDDLSFYDRYNHMLGTVGLPWHSLPGNHDIDVDAADDRHSRDTFRRVFGTRHYAFQHGGVTFLMLDNVEYLGPDPAKPGQLGKYRGKFGAEQLDFLRAVLAHVPPSSLVVCCFHIPLRTVMGDAPNTAAIDTSDFLAAIGTHTNCMSLSGHTHTNEHHYLGVADGLATGEHHHHVLAAVSGSWWSGPFDVRGIPVAMQIDGAPNGHHVLSIDGTTATTRFVPAHDPDAAQLRLMLDSQLHGDGPEVLHEFPVGRLLTGPLDRSAVGGTRLVANLFDGGPRSRLVLSIDGAPALPMAGIKRTDPSVVELYARNAATKKPWVNAAPSSHLWQVTLPSTLSAGIHRLQVDATDEYGRAHRAVMALELTQG